MIEDVKAGRTGCIIVKDLSRFGRNYLDAGEYIEKIFPFLGVRFIAVNDNYDSLGDKKASDPHYCAGPRIPLRRGRRNPLPALPSN